MYCKMPFEAMVKVLSAKSITQRAELGRDLDADVQKGHVEDEA
jgi:hypothetical protein